MSVSTARLPPGPAYWLLTSYIQTGRGSQSWRKPQEESPIFRLRAFGQLASQVSRTKLSRVSGLCSLCSISLGFSEVTPPAKVCVLLVEQVFGISCCRLHYHHWLWDSDLPGTPEASLRVHPSHHWLRVSAMPFSVMLISWSLSEDAWASRSLDCIWKPTVSYIFPSIPTLANSANTEEGEFWRVREMELGAFWGCMCTSRDKT